MGRIRVAIARYEEYRQALHYFIPEFRESLQKYRWTWIIPREVDELINPVLRFDPHVFEHIPTPDLLFEIKKICKSEAIQAVSRVIDAFRNKVSSVEPIDLPELPFNVERTPGSADEKFASMRRAKREALRHALALSSLENESRLEVDAMRIAEKRWNTFIRQLKKRPDEYKKATDSLGRRWPQFAMPWLAASCVDLGESRNGISPPLLILDKPKSSTEKLRRMHHADQVHSDDRRWIERWLNTGGAVYLVQPNVNKEMIRQINSIAGVESKHRKINAARRDMIDAYRWYINKDAIIKKKKEYQDVYWLIAEKMNSRIRLRKSRTVYEAACVFG